MALDLQHSLAKPGIDVGSERKEKLMVQQSTEDGYKNLGGVRQKKKSQGIQLRMPSVGSRKNIWEIFTES